VKRDVSALADREFDLVVVGAGVYGAAIAWDASLRGLDVALIERDDFGAGTSFNNLKTIHGGIRYLQHGDLKRVRESVRERRILMRWRRISSTRFRFSSRPTAATSRAAGRCFEPRSS
jgi:glycerol-3-phosphate dehydrogenase